MGRVVHFEVTADDLKRAADFYAKAFGWRSEGSPFAEGYKLATTGEGSGIDGAIMEREFQAQPTIVWVEVDDIDAAIEGVRNAGGSTVNEKSTIPGQGHVVYMRDTEGNVLGLKQPLYVESVRSVRVVVLFEWPPWCGTLAHRTGAGPTGKQDLQLPQAQADAAGFGRRSRSRVT